jgi:hypothetical protein
MTKGGIPLSEWSGSGATDRLRETVETYSEATTKQTAELIRLSRRLVLLTGLLFIGLIVQVVLAFIRWA